MSVGTGYMEQLVAAAWLHVCVCMYVHVYVYVFVCVCVCVCVSWGESSARGSDGDELTKIGQKEYRFLSEIDNILEYISVLGCWEYTKV